MVLSLKKGMKEPWTKQEQKCTQNVIFKETDLKDRIFINTIITKHYKVFFLLFSCF